MLQYFLGSYIVTIAGIIAAYFWGEHVHSGAGLSSIFIVLVLAVLETSLSFDNAVVNAMKLEKMSDDWNCGIWYEIFISGFGSCNFC